MTKTPEPQKADSLGALEELDTNFLVARVSVHEQIARGNGESAYCKCCSTKEVRGHAAGCFIAKKPESAMSQDSPIASFLTD